MIPFAMANKYVGYYSQFFRCRTRCTRCRGHRLPPSPGQNASVKVNNTQLIALCKALLRREREMTTYISSISFLYYIEPTPLNSPSVLRAIMGDAHNSRSEAEILARQSRPQRNSAWVPRKRDWRYATGVYQHADFDDEPYSRSVWDSLDHYYQAGGREIETARRRHGSSSVAESELCGVESLDIFHTPKSAASTLSIGSAKRALRNLTTYKPMILRRGPWAQVMRLKFIESAPEDDQETEYEIMGLIIRLRFTGKNKTDLQEILEQPMQSPNPSSLVYQNMTPPVSSPNTPATARTAQTIRTPHKLDSIESLYTFPLFKRTWIDETYDFGINPVRAKLRPTGVKVEELSEHFTWYADAVPVDALFPPGVPLSAKEISAFYPHHVRWKGVMVRLTNNGYRGADIMGMQVSYLQHMRGLDHCD
jgi:hypothetical protein